MRQKILNHKISRLGLFFAGLMGILGLLFWTLSPLRQASQRKLAAQVDLPRLMAAVSGGDERAKYDALQTLMSVSENEWEKEYPALLAELKKQVDSGCAQTVTFSQLAFLFAKMGKKAQEAIPYFLSAITKAEGHCELGMPLASKAVFAIDPKNEDLLPILLREFAKARENADAEAGEQHRRTVTGALLYLKGRRSELAAPLRKMLESNNVLDVISSAKVLLFFGAPRDPLYPYLLRALESNQDEARFEACSLLMDQTLFCGKAAAPLAKAARSPANLYPHSGTACLSTLIRREPDEGFPILKQKLKAKDESTVVVGLKVAGGLAHASPEWRAKWQSFLPEVAQKLRAPEGERVRYHAAVAIANFGETARPYLPTLLKMVSDDKNPTVISAAAFAVEHIDPTNAQLVPVLITRSKKGQSDVNIRITSFLASLKNKAEPAIPLLLDQLNESKSSLGLLAYSASAILTIDPSKENVTQVKHALSRKNLVGDKWELAAYKSTLSALKQVSNQN